MSGKAKTEIFGKMTHDAHVVQVYVNRHSTRVSGELWMEIIIETVLQCLSRPTPAGINNQSCVDKALVIVALFQHLIYLSIFINTDFDQKCHCSRIFLVYTKCCHRQNSLLNICSSL